MFSHKCKLTLNSPSAQICFTLPCGSSVEQIIKVNKHTNDSVEVFFFFKQKKKKNLPPHSPRTKRALTKPKYIKGKEKKNRETESARSLSSKTCIAFLRETLPLPQDPTNKHNSWYNFVILFTFCLGSRAVRISK